MMKPSTITNWLTQPSKFSEKDRKDAATLIKAYPYFVPTRYIEAGEHQKKQPFAPAMLNMMHLYMGNWVMFYDFLQSASGTQGFAAGIPAGSVHEEADETFDDIDYADLSDDEVEFGSYEEDDDDDVDDLIAPASDLTEDEMIASDILSDTQEDEAPAFVASEPEPEIATRAQEPVAQKIVEEVQPEIEPAPAVVAEPVKEPEPIPPVADIQKTETIVQSDAATDSEKKPKKTATEKPKDEIPLFYQNRKADSLIQPIYTEDYFLHQGLHVSDEIPGSMDQMQYQEKDEKSLMVVMSFSEWLLHFKTKGEREKEEQQDQKALKTMWQKEKLAAALEEENEEIPETVFEMAVNSITKEDDLASEPLAEIMVKQGKYDKAIDMYRKLSLRNPQKKTYFARKIDELQKEKES